MKKKPPVLKSKTAIGLVFEKGKRIQKFPVKVLYRANETDSNRFLYCTDRSTKKAVDRNRVKRTLRAAIYEIQEHIPQGFDIALISNEKFSEMNFILRVKKIKSALLLMTNE